MKIKSQKDFWSGLMFGSIGAAFAWGATNYTIGEGARMGPGYFPLLLGVLLTLIGIFIVFESLVVETEDGEKVGSFAWKPLFYIIASNVVFGLLLGGLPKIGFPSFGLVIAIYALVFIAAKAGNEFKWKEILILSTILAVGCYLGFVKLLNLQFPVWPSFLVG